MKVPVDIYLKSINSFHKLYEADICTYQNDYNTHAYLPLSLRMYETVIICIPLGKNDKIIKLPVDMISKIDN